MFPEDLIILQDKMKVRALKKTLVDVQVVSQPHIEKQEDRAAFINSINEQIYELEGRPADNEPLDRTGLALFKAGVQGARNSAKKAVQ